MSYDFETRRFAPGGARLSAAHLNHALLGKVDAATLAAEARARTEGDVAAVTRARAEAAALVDALRDDVNRAGYQTAADALSGARLIALINAALPLLPTTQPAPGGGLWNNGGVLCVA